LLLVFVTQAKGEINLSDKKQTGSRLILAVTLNNVEAVKKLLVVDQADPNYVDGSGDSPLALARYLGHSECEELLLQHGATDKK
jgi:ankyrin repeat protein